MIDGLTLMSLNAKISLWGNRYIADLSDGRKLERQDLFQLAIAIYRTGVGANQIDFEWHGGTRMLTAGSKAALLAEVRELQNEYRNQPIST